MNRYKAESQGDARVIWNVIDTWNGSYVRFAISGYSARHDAIKLAKELNKRWWSNGPVRFFIEQKFPVVMNKIFGRP